MILLSISVTCVLYSYVTTETSTTIHPREIEDLIKSPITQVPDEDTSSLECSGSTLTTEKTTENHGGVQHTCLCPDLYAAGPSSYTPRCPVHSESGTPNFDSSGTEPTRENSVISCVVCHTEFARRCNLEMHMRIHTNERPFSCLQCGMDFPHKNSLIYHMMEHTGDKPYRCTVCGHGCVTSGNLKSHMRTHTGERPFSCTVCHKSFTQKSNLNTHMRIHSGEKPYSCTLCDKRFSFKSNRDKHMVTHKTDRPFTCRICGSSFKLNECLERHSTIHARDDELFHMSVTDNVNDGIDDESVEKLSSCEESVDDLGSNHQQNIHARSQRNHNLRVCSLCGKNFLRSTYLFRHMRTRACQRLFLCKTCGMRFNDRSNLKRHEKTHTLEKPHSCPACGKRFTEKRTMRYHISYVCLNIRRNALESAISGQGDFQSGTGQPQQVRQYEQSSQRLENPLEAQTTEEGHEGSYDILTRLLTTDEEIPCNEESRRQIDLIIEDINKTYREKYG